VIGGWAWNDGLGKKIGMTSDRVQEGHSADLMGGLRLPFLGVTLPERNLDEREHVVVKQGILDIYDDFTRHVAEGRGLPVERVREIAQGHVYAGRTALDLKLVDQIATLDETVEMAKSAAGIRMGRRVRIVEYPKPKLFQLPRLMPGVLAGAVTADATEGAPWSYEQRALGFVLHHPGTPLLLTPASLLPDEAASR
jgi:protease-4